MDITDISLDLLITGFIDHYIDLNQTAPRLNLERLRHFHYGNTLSFSA